MGSGGPPGGAEIFAEKNQSRSFLGPKLPRESISGVGFGIRARLPELDDPAVMRQMSMAAAADLVAVMLTGCISMRLIIILI